MQKTFKGTIGTKEFFVEFPDSYTPLATELGLTTTTTADISAGDFVPHHQVLKENGLLFELTVGLANKKRKHLFITLDKLANRNELIGKPFGGSTIQSVSMRTYSRLV
jgi:hypothetical protein